MLHAADTRAAKELQRGRPTGTQLTMRRALALLVVPPLMLFSVLIAFAMASYPGGTWEERQEPGHSQVRNFLCDLVRPVALNGTPNEEGARYAELALLSFAVALTPFFLITPALFEERRRLARLVAVSGALASLGGVGILLVPSYRFGALPHGLMVLLAAVPGLAAALGATFGVWKAERPVPSVRLAALSTLLVFAFAVGVFAVQLSRGTETTPGLPVLEKLGFLLTMSWMVLTVNVVLRRRT